MIDKSVSLAVEKEIRNGHLFQELGIIPDDEGVPGVGLNHLLIIGICDCGAAIFFPILVVLIAFRREAEITIPTATTALAGKAITED